MKWKITPLIEDIKLNNPVLIEGLPGIGNVGKIAADFIVEELKGEKASINLLVDLTALKILS